MAEDIRRDIKWDIISAMGHDQESEFGWKIVGDDFFALVYDDEGNVIKEYAVFISVQEKD